MDFDGALLSLAAIAAAVILQDSVEGENEDGEGEEEEERESGSHCNAYGRSLRWRIVSGESD